MIEFQQSLDAVLADLEKIYGPYQARTIQPNVPRDRLTKDDIQRWTALTGASTSALYDQIAIYLAKGFHSSDLTFDFCDAVANDLFGFINSVEEEFPKCFYDVYCAFDEGEYFHRAAPEKDPIEAYTRPLIAQIAATISN